MEEFHLPFSPPQPVPPTPSPGGTYMQHSTRSAALKGLVMEGEWQGHQEEWCAESELRL